MSRPSLFDSVTASLVIGLWAAMAVGVSVEGTSSLVVLLCLLGICVVSIVILARLGYVMQSYLKLIMWGHAIGIAVWAVSVTHRLIQGQNVREPMTPMDPTRLVAEILIVIAVGRYASVHGGRLKMRILDSLTVSCAGAVILWVLVLSPHNHQLQWSGYEEHPWLISLLLVVNFLLGATVVMAATRPNSRPVVSAVCAVAALLIVISELWGLSAWVAGRPLSIAQLDLLRALALITLDVGVLLTRLIPPEPVRTQLVSDSALLYVPLMIATSLVLVQYLLYRRLDLGTTLLVILILALVLARQWFTLRENEDLIKTLGRREEQLRHQAFHDVLTGLSNRLAFTHRLDRALDNRGDGPVSVVFIDLDGFKAVNDELGHAAGDDLLIQVANRLTATVRHAVALARLSGDEFAVLLSRDADPEQEARQVVVSLRAPFEIAERSIYVTGSVGVACIDEDDDLVTADEVLNRADLAMYSVKRSGRNDYRMHSSAFRLDESDDRVLGPALSAALDNGSLETHFQPIVSLETGRLTGFEALSRWSHGGPVVPPDVFIPVAERAGLLGRLTETVIERSVMLLADWSKHFPGEPVHIGVNVGGNSLHDRGLARHILDTLDRYGVEPGSLAIEVTESAEITDFEHAAMVLEDLRDHGLRVHLDDFGTGYNSVAQLLRLPLDVVKLDRSLIDGLHLQPQRYRMVQGVVDLLRHLELGIIAEGVEDLRQADLLRELGVDSAQGMAFGMAGTADWMMSDIGWRDALYAPTSMSPEEVELPLLFVAGHGWRRASHN